MKRVRSAMLRMLRTTLAVALALPVFAAQPAMAVGETVTIDAHSAWVANDHTPIAFQIDAAGLAPGATYLVAARFIEVAGTSPADDRGFIWKGTTNSWVSFDSTWSAMPTITAASATINDGWVFAKFGDERASGAYMLEVSLLSSANGAVLAQNSTPVTVLDMDTNGQWLNSVGATSAANASVVATDGSSATILAMSRTEPNLVDDDSNGVVDDASENIGGGSIAGDYRLAVPVASGGYLRVNGMPMTGVTDIATYPTPDYVDETVAHANSGADVFPTGAPIGPVATGGNASIVVTWTTPGDADLAGFRVYRWADAPAGAKYTPVKTLMGTAASSVTTFTDPVAYNKHFNYEVRAIDTSGNISARSASVDATATDTSKPVLARTFVGTPSSASYSISATDGALGSGIAAFQYTIKNVASATASPIGVVGPNFATVTPPVTTPGTYTISLMSTDTAGNVATSTVETFTVVADVTKPSVVATLTGTNSANNAFVISATDAGIGVAGLQYKISPTPGATSTPTTTTVPGPSFAATLPITVPGSYTASWIASDLAGNSATGTMDFAVVSSDTVAPITSTTPIPAGWTKDSVTVTMTVVETLSVPPVTYYRLNGGTTTVYAGPLTFSADGTHTIEYWSVDKAWPIDNKETTKTATIRIDKTLPSIVVTATGAFPTTTTIGATVTDALSGVAWTRYRVNGGAWTTGTATVASAPGTYAVDFEAQDNAGNLKSLSTTTIITGPTSISRRASTVVNYGSFATISGVLSAGSLDTTGVAVRLEYLSGSTWRPYPGVTAVTGPGGAYTMRFKPSRNNRLRVALVQTGYLAASTSAEWFMGVRPYVGLQSVGTQRANRTFSMYATMYPRHSAVVKFSVYRKVGSSYRLYRTYNVRNTAIYRARITLRAGTYRIRASHVDSVHLLGVSPYRTVRVR